MTYTLNVKAFTDSISDRSLEQLCRENPDFRFETDANGKLIIMSPTGSESGRRNLNLAFQVELWNRQSKLGIVFDSSTGFKLSNGAIRSPDASWIASFDYTQQKTSSTICPRTRETRSRCLYRSVTGKFCQTGMW